MERENYRKPESRNKESIRVTQYYYHIESTERWKVHLVPMNIENFISSNWVKMFGLHSSLADE